MALLLQTLSRHTAVNYLKVGGMHNPANRKCKVLFLLPLCVCVCVWERDTESMRDTMSVMLPVVAISHLSGVLLKLVQWTGCPLNTFHLCLHRFTEAIQNIYKIRAVKKISLLVTRFDTGER